MRCPRCANGSGTSTDCGGADRWVRVHHRVDVECRAYQGRWLAVDALHGLDQEPLHGILGPADWPGFLVGQRAAAAERQRKIMLSGRWLSQIEGFLESVPLAPERERVLLHTEVTREHLVVNPGTWTLSGLLDFETAMTGDRGYEFVVVGLFVSRGDPRLLDRILTAYGRSFDPRELLAYTLLHVHSNLPECFSELPAPPEPTLDSLALTWFGTA